MCSSPHRTESLLYKVATGKVLHMLKTLQLLQCTSTFDGKRSVFLFWQMQQCLVAVDRKAKHIKKKTFNVYQTHHFVFPLFRTVSYKLTHFPESRERLFSMKLFLLFCRVLPAFSRKQAFQVAWMHYPLFISNYNSSCPGSRERLTHALYCLNDAMGTVIQARGNASRRSPNLLETLS